MKRIRFTRHARGRMRWRRISREEVEAVLRSPERVEQARFGRLNAFGRTARRTLRVLYIEEAEELVVITAVELTRPMS